MLTNVLCYYILSKARGKSYDTLQSIRERKRRKTRESSLKREKGRSREKTGGEQKEKWGNINLAARPKQRASKYKGKYQYLALLSCVLIDFKDRVF